MGKPYIQVTSVLGDSFIEVSDGTHAIKLGLKRAGVEQLVDELLTILDMADSE